MMAVKVYEGYPNEPLGECLRKSYLLREDSKCSEQW